MEAVPLPVPAGSDDVAKIESFLRAARVLRWVAVAELAALALFALYTARYRELGAVHVVLIVEWYFFSIVSLAWVFVKRRALGCTVKQATVLAVDALICLPHSINLVRKLALRLEIHPDLVSLLAVLMAQDDYRKALSGLVIRVEGEVRMEGEDSPRALRLREYRDAIAAECQ
jgi:hypothetical protein